MRRVNGSNQDVRTKWPRRLTNTDKNGNMSRNRGTETDGKDSLTLSCSGLSYQPFLWSDWIDLNVSKFIYPLLPRDPLLLIPHTHTYPIPLQSRVSCYSLRSKTTLTGSCLTPVIGPSHLRFEGLTPMGTDPPTWLRTFDPSLTHVQPVFSGVHIVNISTDPSSNVLSNMKDPSSNVLVLPCLLFPCRTVDEKRVGNWCLVWFNYE